MYKSNGAGAGYTYKLYFYAEVDSPNGRDWREYSMRNEELQVKLEKLLDTSEKIKEIRYYTHPLNEWRVLDSVAYHAYVVFETDKWWWSIEKNDTGITIQRSKKIEFVRDMYNRNERQSRISYEKTEKIQDRTIKQLVEFIRRRNFVNEKYDVLEANCQDFADKIYDEFFRLVVRRA